MLGQLREVGRILIDDHAAADRCTTVAGLGDLGHERIVVGDLLSDRDVAEFARDLTLIRERGYATSRDEYRRDSNMVAVGLSPGNGEMLTLTATPAKLQV